MAKISISDEYMPPGYLEIITRVIIKALESSTDARSMIEVIKTEMLPNSCGLLATIVLRERDDAGNKLQQTISVQTYSQSYVSDLQFSHLFMVKVLQKVKEMLEEKEKKLFLNASKLKTVRLKIEEILKSEK